MLAHTLCLIEGCQMDRRALADESKEMSQSVKHNKQERSRKQRVCAYFIGYCRSIELFGRIV